MEFECTSKFRTCLNRKVGLIFANYYNFSSKFRDLFFNLLNKLLVENCRFSDLSFAANFRLLDPSN